MITETQIYFSDGCGRCPRFRSDACSSRLWQEGLADLRRICLEAGLTETLRWAHPCYRHADRNIAIIGAFQTAFTLTFFNAALMQDPEGILEKAGPNAGPASVIRFQDVRQVAHRSSTLRAYLQEAMQYAQAGLLPSKDRTEPDYPEDLEQALAADPDLRRAFAALTPGRRKSYVLAINAAKQPATRARRLAKFRPGILAGKGALER